MAERERSHSRPLGGVFVPHAQVLTAPDARTWLLTRMSHEVLERNGGLADVVVIGLQTGGRPLARRMVEILGGLEGTTVPVGTLDVAFYRDDIGLRPVLPEAATDVPVELTGRIVVLVDDVLFHRTHGSGRNAERPRRLRPRPSGPAGGDGGSWPPRAAHPAGLRRQEPPDRARRDGGRERRRRQHRKAPGQVSRHLLSVNDLGRDGIEEVLRVSEAFAEVERRPIPKVPTLRGRVVATLFFESSTRTRLSFETAGETAVGGRAVLSSAPRPLR